MSILGNIDPDLNCVQTDECSYYNSRNIDSVINSKNMLNLVHINIRSCSKNLDEFLILLNNLKPRFSVVILTETWLNSIHDWIDVPGYKAFHCVREGRRGGGVTILVDDGLCVSQISQLTCVNDVFESVAVSLSLGGSKYTIVGTYRPPSCSLESFNAVYFNLLRDSNYTDNLFIFGDFNVDMLSASPSGAEMCFRDEINTYPLLSLINIPTRVCSSSATCIDHIYTNSMLNCKSGVLSEPLADHFPVFCAVPIVCGSKSDKVAVKFRELSRPSVESFRNCLTFAMANFNVFDSFPVEDQFEIFDNILMNAYNSNCPIRTKYMSVKRYNSPWLSNSVLNSIREKRRLYFSSLTNPSLLPTYRRYRNILSDTIKRAKTNYYKEKFDSCNNDGKATWKVINSVLSSKNSGQGGLKLLVGGSEVDDTKILCESFNQHFATVPSVLADNIPVVDFNPLTYVDRLPNTFIWHDVTELELIRTIKSFKPKVSSTNTIPNFIYKYVSDIIAPVLSKLINTSVRQGIFPSRFKIARVIPLFKSGSKLHLVNYRPISLLPFLSKVIERLVHVRMTSFLDKYNVLYSDQFGFTKGKSTCDAILKFTELCYRAFNNRKFLLSVFLDFSKAFDTIDQNILIAKLECYGFRGFMLDWFRSYICNRQQFVDIAGSHSSTVTLNYGTGQGTILSPLLFLIYINDMNRCSDLNFVHFADDSTVFYTGDSINELCLFFNYELKRIDSWLCSNKLSLNVSKSSFTIFSNKDFSHHPNILIRNSIIGFLDVTKFLGVTIDNKLNFSSHIKAVCNKVSKSVGIIRKLSSFLPEKIVKQLYLSLVYPHLCYGVEVWGNSCKTELARLTKLQLRCVKLIDNRPPATNNPFVSNRLLCFKDVYKYFNLVRFFKYFVLEQNSYFRDSFLTQSISHPYQTRGRENSNFNIPLIKSSKLYNSFMYNAFILWNRLPNYIKNFSTLKNFKLELRNLMIYSKF